MAIKHNEFERCDDAIDYITSRGFTLDNQGIYNKKGEASVRLEKDILGNVWVFIPTPNIEEVLRVALSALKASNDILNAIRARDGTAYHNSKYTGGYQTEYVSEDYFNDVVEDNFKALKIGKEVCCG